MKAIHLLALLVLGSIPSLAAQAPDSTNDERFKRFLERNPESDINKDGVLTRDEVTQFNAQRRREQPARPTSEERRPRHDNPAPTHADVSYGDHPRQAFDLWLAKPADGKPAPLAIFIHGGGFRGGDKRGISDIPVQKFLDQGISFASMNYRLSDTGPYPMQMHDAARGLQFIRSRASEWNIDKQKVACFGGSAGAGISLWLAFHDDLADPASSDPVARESTRIVAAAISNGQSTYDMRTFREWFGVPDLAPHPALTALYAVQSDADWESERVKKLMADASAITHLSKDDTAPVFATHGRGDVPVDKNTSDGVWVHHVRLGLKLKEAMDKLGIECVVTSPDHPTDAYANLHDFIIRKLKEH
jgi:acetyl esterase/lipase